jgi:hypothetical protein
VTTFTATPNATPAGFTASGTFNTSGGNISVQFGGSNSFNTNKTSAGQTGVRNGDLAITASTDPAISTSNGGSWEEYGAAAGLTYSNFGDWSLNPCSNSSSCDPKYAGTFGGAAFGSALTATMPTSGTASYSGGAEGYVVQPVGTNPKNVGHFYGTSSLSANFGTGAVTGSVTSIQSYSVNNGGSGETLQGTVNNIGLSATISGNKFSGTTNVTGSAGTAWDITGATGVINGGFYGPNAAETAGAFSMSGGTNSTTIIGSFGAKQATSDRRLKEDVRPAGVLSNGLKLYSWRYLGGVHRFTGVMAQDLLGDVRFAGAVEIDAGGLMRVDYGRIGYVPADFDMMVVEGEAAAAHWNGTLH